MTVGLAASAVMHSNTLLSLHDRPAGAQKDALPSAWTLNGHLGLLCPLDLPCLYLQACRPVIGMDSFACDA